MSNDGTPTRPVHSEPRRWLQFSLRTALWMMVVLAVGLGWLADHWKLQRQLAQERVEKEALRIARDYGESSFDAPGLPGYIFSTAGGSWSFPPSSGETDEATVEHFKEFLAGEHTYLANVRGGNPWIFGSGRATVPSTSSTILLADSILADSSKILGSKYIDLGVGHWVSVVQDVAPKDAGSVGELVKRLTDKDAAARARAACTLARLGPNAKDAVAALVECLNDGDGTVRFHAAYALGRIRHNSPEVVAALQAAMQGDGPAAPMAAQTLHRIDPTANIVPRLIELLDDGDAETRRRAVRALLTLPAQPPAIEDPAAAGLAQAVPRLKRLLTDPDVETRKTAMAAVAHLAPLADAHATLGEVVKAGPGTDRDTWTFASLLWNKLDRQVRATQSSEEPSGP